MQTHILENLIKEGLPNADVYVESADGTHFSALVICKDFVGKSRIVRQQMVYNTVNSLLADGSLHALSLKTMTPEEWQLLDNASENDEWKN